MVGSSQEKGAHKQVGIAHQRCGTKKEKPLPKNRHLTIYCYESSDKFNAN
jgi:hypothetical protein